MSLKIFKMATLGPSYTCILEQNDFSNSESLCHSDASNQVWAQSALRFGRCCLKNFKMAPMAATLEVRMEQILPFWIAISPQCLSPSFGLILLSVPIRRCFKIVKLATMVDLLGYWNGTNLAILNLYVTPMPPTMFGLNLTNLSGANMVWRFSSWPPWQPSWILEQKDFSNSNSPCGPNASHQSDLGFRSRCAFKIFKMATIWRPCHLG